MPELRKRASTRKGQKGKVVPTQRSLLDLFSIKAAAGNSPPSTAASESQRSEGDTKSTEASDIELVEISDASPVTTDVEMLSSEGILDDSDTLSGLAHSSFRIRATSPNGVNGGSKRLQTDCTDSHSGQDDLVEGFSREKPIIIDSSPVKPLKASDESPKAFYSIFAPRRKPATRISPIRRSFHNKFVDAPLPDCHTQHVRGPQTLFRPSATELVKRRPDAQHHPTASPMFLSTDPCASSAVHVSGSPNAIAISTPTSEAMLVAPPSLDTRMPCTSDSAAGPSSRNAGPQGSPLLETSFDDIPLSHRAYPAIRRVVELSLAREKDHLNESALSHELWTDKWRPRRADETLGNEDRALYLRAWLLALKLRVETLPSEGPTQNLGSQPEPKKRTKPRKEARGVKRPQVLRQVHKRRKRQRLDSEEPDDAWLVDDGVESDCVWGEAESEDEVAFCQRTLSRLQRAPGEAADEAPCEPIESSTEPEAGAVPDFSCSAPRFGDQIHNTILLHGPSGCGKTAAVYACAEELGWDVFEVYPGIGDRSGTALNKLIGDVGKNHLVKQTQRQQKRLFFGGHEGDAIAGADGMQEAHRPVHRRLRRVDSEQEVNVTDVSGDHAAAPDSAIDSPSQPSVSQSIILVEEVDVLYEGDSNFWPALINIIKDCRRPVVLTCNDVSLIPVNDLPLQEILAFTPCPTPLAASYLRCLSVVERRPVPRGVLSRLYERVDDAEQHKVLSKTSPTVRTPDLRGAILQLQFWVVGHPESSKGDCPNHISVAPPDSLPELPCNEASQMGSPEALRRMDQCQRNLSFVDCYLHLRWEDLLTETMMVEPRTADTELGYTPLPCGAATAASALPVNESFYRQDVIIAREALARCQNQLGCKCFLPTDLQGCAPSARERAAQTIAGLEELQIPVRALTDRTAVFMDYGPWVRYMVGIDDANMAALQESSAAKEGTRRTRNSQKSYEIVRHIPMSEAGRWTLARGALCIPA